MKYFLIFIHLIIIVLLFLNFFEVINYKYLSVICYTIILFLLLLTLWMKKNEKKE